MPFLKQDQVNAVDQPSIGRQRDTAQPAVDDSWGAVFDASRRHYGPTWSAISEQALADSHQIEIDNPDQAPALRELKRMQEAADNEVLQNAPWHKALVAGAAGYMSDPLNLTLAVTTGGIGNAMTAGAGAVRTGVTIGAMEAAGTATSELMLHQVQETRTVEESAMNTGASFLFAGALSGVGRGYMSRTSQQHHQKLLKEGLTDTSAEDVYHSMQVPGGDQPAVTGQVGSQSPLGDANADVIHMDRQVAASSDIVEAPRQQRQVAPIIPQGMSPSETLRVMEGDRLYRIEGLADRTAFTPDLRIATAQSLEARQFGQNLMGDTFTRERNLSGQVTEQGAFFEKQRNFQKIAGEVNRIDNSSFGQFKRLQLDDQLERQLIDEINSAGLADEFAKTGSNVAKALKSRAIFRGLVSHAMRNGDEHILQPVTNAARRTRAVTQPYFDRAVQHGLVQQEALSSLGHTALSYLPKSYRKSKMIAHKPEVEAVMRTDGMRRGLTPEQSIAMSTKFFDDLTGVSDEVMPYSSLGLSSDPFKARTALVRDNDINRFLNNDYVQLWTTWGDRVAGELALADKGIVGDGDAYMAMVNQSYHKLINDAHAAGDQKLVRKLDKEWRVVTDDLKHFIREIRGLKPPIEGWQRPVATSFSNVRKIAASIKMAGVLVTSLVDLAAHTYHYGMPTQIKLMKNLATSPEFREALRTHADIVGVGFERQLNARMQSIADYTVDSMYSDRHKITKMSDFLARHLPVYSGISHWNDFGKSVASMGHAVKATKLLKKGELDKFELAYLSQDGIGIDGQIDWRVRIVDQIDKHGESVDGVMMPNTGAWDDIDAASRFEQFLFKKTNSTIITSTPGTVPLAMQNDPFVKTMMQFTTFVVTSHEQLLLSGVQKSTADMATGVLAFLTVGAMVAQAKSFLRDGTFIEDGDELMFNAIDQSGLLALPLEINNRLGKLGTPTVQGMFGVGQAKRMATQTAFSAVLGPAAGLVEDGAKLTEDLSDGELSDKGVRAATRLLPYVTTHFLTKYLMEQVTKEMMLSVGKDQ